MFETKTEWYETTPEKLHEFLYGGLTEEEQPLLRESLEWRGEEYYKCFIETLICMTQKISYSFRKFIVGLPVEKRQSRDLFSQSLYIMWSHVRYHEIADSGPYSDADLVQVYKHCLDFGMKTEWLKTHIDRLFDEFDEYDCGKCSLFLRDELMKLFDDEMKAHFETVVVSKKLTFV